MLPQFLLGESEDSEREPFDLCKKICEAETFSIDRMDVAQTCDLLRVCLLPQTVLASMYAVGDFEGHGRPVIAWVETS